MAKKIEQEATPIVDRRLEQIALTMGIECEEDDALLAETIIKKLEEVDNRLSPLAEQMERDPRVASLIKLLTQGIELDEAVDTILTKEHNPEDPRYIASLKETELFCEKHQMEHDAIECFLQYIEEILTKLSNGEICGEVLEKLWKSFVYDKEVPAAFEAGAVKGRNMQIEARRAEREEGDGLGELPAGTTVEPTTEKLGYIEQLMRNRR